MTTLAPSFFNLAVNKDFHKTLNEFDFPPSHPPATELAALERQKYSCLML